MTPSHHRCILLSASGKNWLLCGLSLSSSSTKQGKLSSRVLCGSQHGPLPIYTEHACLNWNIISIMCRMGRCSKKHVLQLEPFIDLAAIKEEADLCLLFDQVLPKPELPCVSPRHLLRSAFFRAAPSERDRSKWQHNYSQRSIMYRHVLAL